MVRNKVDEVQLNIAGERLFEVRSKEGLRIEDLGFCGGGVVQLRKSRL
jgi:hypothetical protein